MGFMASYDIKDCPTLVLVSTIAPAFFTRLVSSKADAQVFTLTAIHKDRVTICDIVGPSTIPDGCVEPLYSELILDNQCRE